MEKKTMGAFISALRKANGMTQQQLADKLNISNKAVSRWERDECAPDISLIPPLAEILGVTCDELLKGERILSDCVQSEPKVEKQVRALINKAINFKTLIWISLALSAVGLICMFGISYGAYLPIVGFIVMSIMALGAFVTAAIGLNKFKAKRENDMFENADKSLIEGFNSTLGIYSYTAFCTSIWSVAISLPYICYSNNAVLTFISYLTLFGWITPALVLVFLALKDRYCAWITGQPYQRKIRERNSNLFLMNILQWGVMVFAGILFIIAPYFTDYNKVFSAEDALLVIAYFLLPASAVVFTVLMIICKADRKKLVLPGIRNMLLLFPALLMHNVHNVEMTYLDVPVYEEWWDLNYLLSSLGLTLLIFMIFEIIKAFKKEV